MSLSEHLAVEQGMNYQIPKVADRLPYYLGSVTLFGIIIQIVTGIYLAQFYNPEDTGAHQSIIYIISRARFGDFVRSLHRWTADLVLITVTLHLLWVFWRGSYKHPREVTWWAGVLLLGVLFLFYFTGTVLPYDQSGYEALAHNVAAARTLGIFGSILTPEFTPSVDLLPRLYVLHISILPLLFFAFMGVHLYLIRFLDIHTHPGEDKHGSTFLEHFRKMFAHGFILLAVAGLLSILWPAELGFPAVEGAEVTKPPFAFRWIYAVENMVGMKAMVLFPPVVYLSLFLPPLLDRKVSTLPRDRRGIIAMGFALILLLLGLMLYATLMPAQQHVM